MYRIDFAQIRETARGKWISLLPSLCGVECTYLVNRHGPCPVCGGKDRFRFDDKDGSGTWFCNNCGAGDGFKLIQKLRNCSPRESFELVSDSLRPGVSQLGSFPVLREENESNRESSHFNETTQQRNNALWQRGHEIAGTCAEQYLLQRGLTLIPPPQNLRFVEQIAYWDTHKQEILGYYSALLGRVENLQGELVAVHRTYLTPDAKKASVASPKKLTKSPRAGITAGGAIRLYPPDGDLLGVCEGIETAIACHNKFQVPTWAAVSANGLSAITLPQTIRRVVVFADNDASLAGQKHAEKLVERLRWEGRHVKSVMPNQCGTDWAT